MTDLDLQTGVLDLLATTLQELGRLKAREVALEQLRNSLENEGKVLTQSLSVMTAQRDRAQQQLRDERQKQGEADPKFKALYEAAESMRMVTRMDKNRRSLNEKLAASLKAAHQHIDWIPF